MSYTQMEGLLLINKPKRWTSYDVCHFIKRKYRVKKVGHTGTLDPQATGVLVILLGRYTRLSQIFVEQGKSYRGTLCLGIRTDSQDGDGKVVEERPWSHITEEDIERIAQKFRGELYQKPPMISAVKHHGKRLYKLARQGEVVEREARRITVYQFNIEGIRFPRVDFSVEVSKGTYVRTLAEDFGTALGSTAFLEDLCRTSVGTYKLSECLEMSDLEKISSQDDLKPFLIREIREGHNEITAKELSFLGA